MNQNEFHERMKKKKTTEKRSRWLIDKWFRYYCTSFKSKIHVGISHICFTYICMACILWRWYSLIQNLSKWWKIKNKNLKVKFLKTKQKIENTHTHTYYKNIKVRKDDEEGIFSIRRTVKCMDSSIVQWRFCSSFDLFEFLSSFFSSFHFFWERKK